MKKGLENSLKRGSKVVDSKKHSPYLKKKKNTFPTTFKHSFIGSKFYELFLYYTCTHIYIHI